MEPKDRRQNFPTAEFRNQDSEFAAGARSYGAIIYQSFARARNSARHFRMEKILRLESNGARGASILRCTKIKKDPESAKTQRLFRHWSIA
jgi:hypothetical protein